MPTTLEATRTVRPQTGSHLLHPDWRYHDLYGTLAGDIRAAVAKLNLGSATEAVVLSRLMHPELVIHDRLGPIKAAAGARVRFDTLMGPAQGGVRLIVAAAAEDPEDVLHRHLAHLGGLGLGMVAKGALNRIRRGGAKGLIVVPSWYTNEQIDQTLRDFVDMCGSDIGPGIDGLGPDMGMTPYRMQVMQDRFTEAWTGPGSPICMTNLPEGQPGFLAGRDISTGLWLAEYTRLHLESGHRLRGRRNLTMDGWPLVSLNGFGQVSRAAAERFASWGCAISSIVDRSTTLRGQALFNPNGIDIDAAAAYADAHGGALMGFDGAELISLEEHYRLGVTVYVAASTEGVITPDIAQILGAEVLAEGGNMPQRNTATRQVLADREIEVVTWLAGSAGGMYASDLSLQQVELRRHYSLEWVVRSLQAGAASTFGRMLDLQDRYGCSPTEAAARLVVRSYVERL